MLIGFRNIWALVLAASALVIIWRYVVAGKAASGARDVFADPVRQAPLGLGQVGWRAHAAPVLVVLAAVLASIAIARPLGPPDKKESGSARMDVIVALDVSDSMAVPDIGDSRLDTAKLAVAELVSAAPSNRYGLVLFSGEAVVSCPLTVDQDAFLTFLDGTSYSNSGLPGTAIGEAILTAATRFKKSELPRAVVVVSDGENTYGANPQKAAATAKGMGIRVYTLGVGTKEGGRIPIGRDFFGKLTYKLDRSGKVVNSSLDDSMLADTAASGGGVYLDASDSGSVNKLAGMLHTKKTTAVKGIPPDAKEYGPYFALGAFALLVMAIAI